VLDGILRKIIVPAIEAHMQNASFLKTGLADLMDLIV
jgi:hypothetical protein